MFVGRERELEAMERLYEREGFQMLVIYGRRRIGKTALIEEFCKGRRTLAFMAQTRSDYENLAEFSRLIWEFFGLPSTAGSFPGWIDAFSYIAEYVGDERIVLVIDEFPYAVEANPSLPSKLQIAIDHAFLGTNIFLILCGSNQGFMENEVLGYKSPLYGRRTGQLQLKAFDCFDTARMLDGIPMEEVVKYYACVGGTPYYLAQIDQDASFEENIANLYFDKTGFLYEEPVMLLRQELREPAMYSSLLSAIANGANKPTEIANRVGANRGTVGKYLNTLIGLHLIRRVVPFGENPETTRRAVYTLDDACYAFWYRFVMRYAADIEADNGRSLARRAAESDGLTSYIARRFETISLEWLRRQMDKDALPINAVTVGTWWGNDPVKREQTDIDVLAADTFEKLVLIGECKWRNELDETEAIERLVDKARLLKGYDVTNFYLFTKHEAAAGTKDKYGAKDEVCLVSLVDMFASEGVER